jgi:uncharacterized membrane protein
MGKMSKPPTRGRHKPTAKDHSELSVASTTVTHQSASFHGPIPHPALLKGYEEILPGAADRILRMAEEDLKHTHEIDTAIQRADEKEVRRGQIMAFLLVIVAFASAIGIYLLGSELVALTIAGTTIGGIITSFILSRRAEERK